MIDCDIQYIYKRVRVRVWHFFRANCIEYQRTGTLVRHSFLCVNNLDHFHKTLTDQSFVLFFLFQMSCRRHQIIVVDFGTTSIYKTHLQLQWVHETM